MYQLQEDVIDFYLKSPNGALTRQDFFREFCAHVSISNDKKARRPSPAEGDGRWVPGLLILRAVKAQALTHLCVYPCGHIGAALDALPLRAGAGNSAEQLDLCICERPQHTL